MPTTKLATATMTEVPYPPTKTNNRSHSGVAKALQLSEVRTGLGSEFSEKDSRPSRIPINQQMKLKDQVCSLELAKKLKELGVRQESLFGYAPTGNLVSYVLTDSVPWPDSAAAFTVAELGEMLPNDMECVKSNDPTKPRWMAFQTLDGNEPHYADTEADARAKMLIYSLENKLITLN